MQASALKQFHALIQREGTTEVLRGLPSPCLKASLGLEDAQVVRRTTCVLAALVLVNQYVRYPAIAQRCFVTLACQRVHLQTTSAATLMCARWFFSTMRTWCHWRRSICSTTCLSTMVMISQPPKRSDCSIVGRRSARYPLPICWSVQTTTHSCVDHQFRGLCSFGKGSLLFPQR